MFTPPQTIDISYIRKMLEHRLDTQLGTLSFHAQRLFNHDRYHYRMSSSCKSWKTSAATSEAEWLVTCRSCEHFVENLYIHDGSTTSSSYSSPLHLSINVALSMIFRQCGKLT